MTQEQLSTKMMVTRSTVSKWESGTYEPEISSLKRLSEVFEITIDDIIFKDLEENSNSRRKNE